jgi:hypothetical protein
MSPKKIKKKNNIIPHMFDVRPARLADDLALGRKPNIPKVVNISTQPRKTQRKKIFSPLNSKIFTGLNKKVNIAGPISINRNKRNRRKIDLSDIKVVQLNKYLDRDNYSPIPYFNTLSRVKKEALSPREKETARRSKILLLPEKKEYLIHSSKCGKEYPFEENYKRSDSVCPVNKNEVFIKEKDVLSAGKQRKQSRDWQDVKDYFSKKIDQRSGHMELSGKLLSGSFGRSEKRNALPVLKNFFQHSFRPAFGFMSAMALLLLFFLSIKFVSFGFQKKDEITIKGMAAVNQLAQAKNEMISRDFENAHYNIENAKNYFNEAREELDRIGGNLSFVFSKLPFLSKISSGKYLLNAGQEISVSISDLNQAAALIDQLDNPLETGGGSNIGEIVIGASKHLLQSKEHLEKANSYLENVKLVDLPKDFQADFSKGREALPEIIKIIDALEENYQIFYEIFGYNGPRKYLFLFQNNQEIRATGGFIGSYGILSIDNGKMESLFIDGIFNPDGQLHKKVVPPQPIQKISAAWSTHDANWFPHFPTSAEKIAWFYEKTGGPTVDGIITITPTVLEKLLKITGPIEMSEYNVVINSENFIEKTQYEVEIDYDKELNQPKKIIADMAPLIFDRIFSSRNPQDVSKAVNILSQSLKEKHILIYSFDHNIQKILSSHNWSGEIMQTNNDYLMVINSNINGYKTDGVIKETISHKAEVQDDGSIIDTVRIKREHTGGNSEYEWWNKVNSDYMRVYVPMGSRLLEARGHTREFNQSPLDYDALGFQRDPRVEQEEQDMKIDEKTGTRIYDEEHKTVFANWVYVSPQETVEVEYKYLLPFKIDFDKNEDRVDSYSILFQKQSGSIGTKLNFQLSYPDQTEALWMYPQQDQNNSAEYDLTGELLTDQFFGAVLRNRSY